MQSFSKFITERFLPISVSLAVDISGHSEEKTEDNEPVKRAVAFKGATILSVAKSIAEKCDTFFHDPKLAKNAMIEVRKVSIQHEHVKVERTAAVGRSFSQHGEKAEEIVLFLIRDYSKVFKHRKGDQLIATMTMFGNSYVETADDDSLSSFHDTDELEGVKAHIRAQSGEEFAKEAAYHIEKEFRKRGNHVTLTFDGTDDLDDGLYKAVVAAKTDSFHF